MQPQKTQSTEDGHDRARVVSRAALRENNNSLRRLVEKTECNCVKVRASWVDTDETANQDRIEKFFSHGSFFYGDFYFDDERFSNICAHQWIRKRETTRLDLDGEPTEDQSQKIETFKVTKQSVEDSTLSISHHQTKDDELPSYYRCIGEVSSRRAITYRTDFASVYIEYVTPAQRNKMVWYAGVTIRKDCLTEENADAWDTLESEFFKLPQQAKQESNIFRQPKMIRKWQECAKEEPEFLDIPETILKTVMNLEPKKE